MLSSSSLASYCSKVSQKQIMTGGLAMALVKGNRDNARLTLGDFPRHVDAAVIGYGKEERRCVKVIRCW